ncbi:hypothetical protein SBY92_004553 [Candida maltosa Xu316]
MPLTLSLHEDDNHVRPINDIYNQLRLNLIGNKDLKYKLVGDVEFIHQLASDFNLLIDQLIKSDNLSIQTTNQMLNDLEKLAVITNILCVFSIEVDNKKDENITQCLQTMKSILNPIIKLLNYFIQLFIPKLYTTSTDESQNLDIYKVKHLIKYALDILLGLTNSKDHELDTTILWKFIISLLIVTDSNHSHVSLIDSSILIKSLRLVPLLLASNCEISNTSLITLLTALLNRLSHECDNIIASHFQDLYHKTNMSKIFHQMAFEDSCLPNIDLNESILDKAVDVPLLQELITCTAQIFSFSKVHDYDILMASPNTDPSCTGTNDISKTKKKRKKSASSPVIVLSINVYLSLLLLVKYDDNRPLNLAALNLITFYLNNLKPSQDIDKSVIFKSYRKLFPRIICMLDLQNDYTGANNVNLPIPGSRKSKEPSVKPSTKKPLPYVKSVNYDIPMFLLSPARILSDLCVQYPKLNDEIHDANIDYKLVEKLQLSFNSSKLLKSLKFLKSSSKNGKNLVDFTVMLTTEKDEIEVADLMLLLSVYTSNREDYRNRIVNPPAEYNINLTSIVFEVVDDYYFLLNQLNLVYVLLKTPRRKKHHFRFNNNNIIDYPRVPVSDLPWFGRNLGIISTLHDSLLSISRSVASLRTFFVECNSFTSFSTNSSNTVGQNSTNNSVDNVSGINSASSTTTFGGSRNRPLGRQPNNSQTSVPSSGTVTGSGTTSGNGIGNGSGIELSSSFNNIPGGFITNILQIIHSYENLFEIFEFFYNVNNYGGKNSTSLGKNMILNSKKNLMTNKSLCIGLLANFILDFSSFRYKIIGYENFLSSLLTIYQKSSTEDEPEVNEKEDEEIYQKNVIQLKILQVIKNFMYNEATENKKEVLDYFSLNLILEKASFGITEGKTIRSAVPTNSDVLHVKLQQKIVSFEILRNFTAGSPNFNSLLIESYENNFIQFAKAKNIELPSTWIEFLISNITNIKIFLPDIITNSMKEMELFYNNDEILGKLIQNEDYIKLIRSINHTEDHRYTIVEKVEKVWFPNDELLKIWLRLLSFTIPLKTLTHLKNNEKITIFNNLYNIHSSIIWIIVNLTWKYSSFGGVNQTNIHDYSKYDIYSNDKRNPSTQTPARITLSIDDDDVIMKDATEEEEQEENDKESTVYEKKKLDKRSQESSVYERAKHLDNLGFTKVIKKLIKYYSQTDDDDDNSHENEIGRNSFRIFKSNIDHKPHTNKNTNQPAKYLIAKGHDILEKLEIGLRQINELLNDEHDDDNGKQTIDKKDKNGKELRLQVDGEEVIITERTIGNRRREDNVSRNVEHDDSDDEYARFALLNRRDAIDSEDNDHDEHDDHDHEEEEEEEEDVDVYWTGRGELGRRESESELEEEEGRGRGGDEEEEEGESDSEELPDEYWVM